MGQSGNFTSCEKKLILVPNIEEYISFPINTISNLDSIQNIHT